MMLLDTSEPCEIEDAQLIAELSNELLERVKETARTIIDRAQHTDGYDTCPAAPGVAQQIRPNMDVIATCGTIIGTIERVDINAIKLAKCGPKSADNEQWIPLAWIEAVGQWVCLNKTLAEVINTRNSSCGRPIRLIERRRSQHFDGADAAQPV